MPMPFGWGAGTDLTAYTFDTDMTPGASQVSLSDIFNNPTASLNQIQRNIESNWAGIVVGSLLNEISWKVARKLLSKPVNRFNRAVFGKRGIIGNIGFKL